MLVELEPLWTWALVDLFLIYYFFAMLHLRCCAWAFSRCGGLGLLSGAQTSPCCTAQALECSGSVVVTHGLSCPEACGIFLDQGLNPRPLHWQVNS